MPKKERRTTEKSGSFRIVNTIPPQSGVDFPTDRASCELMFATERACLAFVERLRFPRGFLCPECESRQAPWRSPGCAMVACSDCRKPMSLLSGTPMHGSAVPLTVWFRALWTWCKSAGGMPSRAFGELLGLRDVKRARVLQRRLRARLAPRSHDRLAGEVRLARTKLEVDPGEKPRSFIMAVEQTPEQVRLRVGRLERGTAGEVMRFVAEHVDSGSLVVTPPWRGLGPLRSLGFFHSMRPSQHASIALDPAEVTSQLRLWLWSLPSQSGRLQPLLDEFAFRYEHQELPKGLVWRRLMERVLAPSTEPAEELLSAVG